MNALPLRRGIAVGDAFVAKNKLKVVVTGAGGQIGYAFLFRLLSRQVFGPNTAIDVRLLEANSPEAIKKAEGTAMEMLDCAFPAQGAPILVTSDPNKAFEGCDYAVLIGAKPRTKGMERADLLLENAAIFKEQGKAINKVASDDCRVLVVGNPCNTNALITGHYASKLPKRNITAMTKLDANRAVAQLALKSGLPYTDYQDVVVWGNHSPTMVPTLAYAKLKGKPMTDADKKVYYDGGWFKDTFMPTVQKRGAEIIAKRGASSAASAANAAIEHLFEWHHGTSGRYTSMVVSSEGEYGVPKGLWCSFPVTIKDRKITIVPGLDNAADKEAIFKSVKELQEELDGVKSFLS